MKSKYAEDRPYWDTTVHPAKSMGEIQEMLEDFGVENIMVMQGKSEGKQAWIIRFQWQTKTYRFVFTPLECNHPNFEKSFGGKRRTFAEQAYYQMGRTAVHFIKAILTAAEVDPDALFGFVELSAGNNQIMTAAELDISGLVRLLPNIEIPQFTAGEIEGKIMEVNTHDHAA